MRHTFLGLASQAGVRLWFVFRNNNMNFIPNILLSPTIVISTFEGFTSMKAMDKLNLSTIDIGVAAQGLGET